MAHVSLARVCLWPVEGDSWWDGMMPSLCVHDLSRASDVVMGMYTCCEIVYAVLYARKCAKTRTW